jgi:hypothetical protein
MQFGGLTIYIILPILKCVRFGPRAHGEEVMSMFGNSRAEGFGPEVKIRSTQ